MDIILIAGLWLRSSVWDDVAAELTRLGHRPHPLDLPGADDASTVATLADQVEAAVAAVDGAERPLVVGHSAACTLAWMVADSRPASISGVVMIGGFPSANGTAYADFFPTADGVMAFPGWKPFEGPDADDLDDAARRSLESTAVPVPANVSTATVRYHDDRRSDVPVMVVCPEFSPEQARAWLEAGDIPELAAASRLELVDIASGHWPMVTRPVELARIVADCAVGMSR